jgi:hypothetical protein
MAGLLPTCALTLLASLSPGAPLPLPKEAPPTHAGLLGTWKAEWSGGAYLITFGPRGVYGAHLSDCGGACCGYGSRPPGPSRGPICTPLPAS